MAASSSSIATCVMVDWIEVVSFFFFFVSRFFFFVAECVRFSTRMPVVRGSEDVEWEQSDAELVVRVPLGARVNIKALDVYS